MQYHYSSIIALLPLLWISSAIAVPAARASSTSMQPVSPSSPVSQSSPAKISFEEAERIALKAVPGSKIVSIEREVEWRRVVYEVEVLDQQATEWEIVIDGSDGSILDMEHD